MLKARVLIALYSVRSERQFCQLLPHALLFQWFMNINLEETAAHFFDSSVSPKTRRAS